MLPPRTFAARWKAASTAAGLDKAEPTLRVLCLLMFYNGFSQGLDASAEAALSGDDDDELRLLASWRSEVQLVMRVAGAELAP